MINRYAFTQLIHSMEGIHDLEEVIEQIFGFNPGPHQDTILSRLFAVEEAVYEILDVPDDRKSELREIAGSDMDLDKKVEILMQLYPGRVAENSAEE